jgi:hypothetical protein
MLTIGLLLFAASIPANTLVHRFRRGRWEWTFEEGFLRLN